MNETETKAAAYNQPREWLLWMAATTGGWVLGTAISFLLSLVLSVTGLSDALNADPASITQSTMLLLMGVSLVILLIIGASVGAMQWLVLRRHLADVQRWAVFTGVGFALGSFAFLAFMGAGVGLMQWLLLRRDLNKTGWWAVICAVAWPLGYMVGGNLGVTVGAAVNSTLLANLLSAALTGVIIGAVTGAVLLWLLRENAALLESLRREREEKTVRS
jgi:hypothetical protein